MIVPLSDAEGSVPYISFNNLKLVALMIINGSFNLYFHRIAFAFFIYK